MSSGLDPYKLTLKDQASLSDNPASGDIYLYSKSGVPYYKIPSGTETPLGGDTVTLYGSIAPNNSGEYLFDVNTALALTCEHIEISYALKGGVGATFDSLYTIFNGDTTAANYRNQYINGAAATVSSATANNPLTGFITGNTATDADAYSIGIMRINFFRSTVFEKVAHFSHSYRIGTDPLHILGNVTWIVAPAAITSIRLRPDGYSTDVFNSNSRVSVRGIRAA